jgi:predicted nucleic acid-binding protein
VDNLVVDASVLGAYFLAEENSEEIETILETVPEIYSPLFWRFEVSNAIWRRRDIPEMIGKGLVERIWELPVNDEFPTEQAKYAFAISRKYNLTFYDSSYIAIAKLLNIPLWTYDKAQHTAAMRIGVSLWKQE